MQSGGVWPECASDLEPIYDAVLTAAMHPVVACRPSLPQLLDLAQNLERLHRIAGSSAALAAALVDQALGRKPVRPGARYQQQQ